MKKGTIIYLEGVSSSGKTTLSRILQKRLPEPFFWLAGEYDIIVDTYANSSEECADKIIEMLSHSEKFTVCRIIIFNARKSVAFSKSKHIKHIKT